MPALAQANNSELEARLKNQRDEGWYNAAPGFRTPVFDTPFSAETTTTWQPGGSESSIWSVTTRYDRDRAGRFRVEQMFGHAGDQSPQRIIVAPDPNSRRVYVIDAVRRTASELGRTFAAITVGGWNRLVLPVSMSQFMTFPRPHVRHSRYDAALDEESLGQRVISGIQTTGTRLKTILPAGAMGGSRPIQIVEERWVSPELQLVVYSRNTDSEIGIVEHRLTKISRADPPEELFEVPTDYVAVPTNRLGLLNPYAPGTWDTALDGR
jgi:hypothetical protein